MEYKLLVLLLAHADKKIKKIIKKVKFFLFIFPTLVYIYIRVYYKRNNLSIRKIFFLQILGCFMKKIVILLVLLIFAIPIYASNKPIFNIMDNECVVFIQGSNINSSINAPLEIFLNTVTKAELQIWYIKKDLYDRIKFNNNTYCELAGYTDDSNEVLLYKKGRSYYRIKLNDANIAEKVNTYFGRKVYPVFTKRSKFIYEKSYEGVIYIKHSEREMYDLTNGYLEENEQVVYLDTQEKMRSQLITDLSSLKISFKEADPYIKNILFPNSHRIALEGLGGNVIFFKQGKKPEIMPLSSINMDTINTYFERRKK